MKTYQMQIIVMNCTNLNEVSFALNASWLGDSVVCNYMGVSYDLFSEIDDAHDKGAHKQLIALGAGYIECVKPSQSIVTRYVDELVYKAFQW